MRPVAALGFLKWKFLVDGADLQVALPEDHLLVLQSRSSTSSRKTARWCKRRRAS